MLRRIFYLLTIIFFSKNVFGQGEVSIVAYWSKGDSFDYEITKIKKKWKDNRITKNDSITYKANLTVIDSTEAEYTLEWKYNIDITTLPGIEKSEIRDKLLSLYSEFFKEPTIVTYKTDELGTFTEVVNWRELARNSSNLYKKLGEFFKKENFPNADMLVKNFNNLSRSFSSKEAVESYYINEIQLLHSLFGKEYELNEFYEVEDEVIDPVLGTSLRANVRLYVDSFDIETGVAKFHLESDINPEDKKESMLNWVEMFNFKNKPGSKELQSLTAEELKKLITELKLEISDSIVLEINADDGVVLFVNLVSTSYTQTPRENNKEEETIRIRLVNDN